MARPMTSRAYCDETLPGTGGRRCPSLLFVLPGRWAKVRVLHPGEPAEEGRGVVFCNNPRCKAKWEIRRVCEEVA